MTAWEQFNAAMRELQAAVPEAARKLLELSTHHDPTVQAQAAGAIIDIVLAENDRKRRKEADDFWRLRK